MQFDLFYEIAQPPFLGRSESDAYRELLEQIEFAGCLQDRLSPGSTLMQDSGSGIQGRAARNHY